MGIVLVEAVSVGLERESLICQFTGVPRLEEASMPIVIAQVAAMSGWDVLVGWQQGLS